METFERIVVTDYSKGGVKVPAVIKTVKTDKETKMYLRYVKE